MAEIDVRIVNLEPMRVASAFGFGDQPEMQAWTKILAWARAEGYEDLGKHRFFGFNNPSPSPGSPNYGYEQWMTVGAEVVGNDDIEIKEFPGGLYAVTRSESLQNIAENWKNWQSGGKIASTREPITSGWRSASRHRQKTSKTMFLICMPR